MQKITKYQLSSGETIAIEVDESTFGGGQPVGLGENISNSTAELMKQYASVSNFITEFKQQISNQLDDASEISLEFGVKIGADVGIFVAKSQVEANFKVSVSWKK